MLSRSVSLAPASTNGHHVVVVFDDIERVKVFDLRFLSTFELSGGLRHRHGEWQQRERFADPKTSPLVGSRCGLYRQRHDLDGLRGVRQSHSADAVGLSGELLAGNKDLF